MTFDHVTQSASWGFNWKLASLVMHQYNNDHLCWAKGTNEMGM